MQQFGNVIDIDMAALVEHHGQSIRRASDSQAIAQRRRQLESL
ncbi:MAG: hypothetical protein ACXIVF_04550 [Rhizobiaceae bacterium]